MWIIYLWDKSLAFGVLQSKYFPNKDSIDAKLGRNASLIWRSIRGAREELKKGLCWRIEDSEKIEVWKDNWLGCNTMLQSKSDRDARDNDETLNVFINIDTMTWRIELVDKVFINVIGDTVVDFSSWWIRVLIQPFTLAKMRDWFGRKSGDNNLPRKVRGLL